MAPIREQEALHFVHVVGGRLSPSNNTYLVDSRLSVRSLHISATLANAKRGMSVGGLAPSAVVGGVADGAKSVYAEASVLTRERCAVVRWSDGTSPSTLAARVRAGTRSRRKCATFWDSLWRRMCRCFVCLLCSVQGGSRRQADEAFEEPVQLGEVRLRGDNKDGAVVISDAGIFSWLACHTR